MDFRVDRYGTENSRSGELIKFQDDEQSNEKVSIQTPCCVFNTQGGSLPLVTSDLMDEYLGESLFCCELSQLLPRMRNGEKTEPKFLNESQIPSTEAEFLHLEKKITILKYQSDVIDKDDNLYKYCKEKYFPIRTRQGLMEISNNEYQDSFLNKLGFSLYEIPSDIVPKDETKKRHKKALDRNLKVANNAIESITDPSVLIWKKLLLPVIVNQTYEGEDVIRKLKNMDVFGYVFYNYNSPIYELEKFIQKLDQHKLRILFGPASLERVEHMIRIGIDMFDVTYPLDLSQNGMVLCPEKLNGIYACPPNVNILSVSEEKMKDVFDPVMKECECYCCKNYSIAYLNHLLANKEMLATILINIHNIFQYQSYIEFLRDNIRSNNPDDN